MFQVLYVGEVDVVIDFVVFGFEEVVDGEVFYSWYCVGWCVLYFGKGYQYLVVNVYVQLDCQFFVQQQVEVVWFEVVIVVFGDFFVDY